MLILSIVSLALGMLILVEVFCSKSWRLIPPRHKMYLFFYFAGNTVTSTKNGRTYKIETNLHCDSRFVVYCVTCKGCKAQYVGSTSKSFKDRYRGHRASIRNPEQQEVFGHFRKPGHVYQVQIIKQSSPANLLLDEQYYFECIEPELNRYRPLEEKQEQYYKYYNKI